MGRGLDGFLSVGVVQTGFIRGGVALADFSSMGRGHFEALRHSDLKFEAEPAESSCSSVGVLSTWTGLSSCFRVTLRHRWSESGGLTQEESRHLGTLVGN